MRVKLLPYAPSKGARALANALGIRRLRVTGSRWRPRWGDTVVNWGRGDFPEWPDAEFLPRWINPPDIVRTAQSKLESLTKMKAGGINVPDFTQDINVARGWLSGGNSVICRALDRGSAGRGITFVERGSDPSELPQVGLYTCYEPRFDEYRLHVFRGPDGSYSVVDSAQKRKRNGVENVDFKVRTHANGWVYCRENCSPPEDTITQSKLAVQALGLDFGAVDIGWTRITARATVFEVNTAPGLEGTTVQRYADAMSKLIWASV